MTCWFEPGAHTYLLEARQHLKRNLIRHPVTSVRLNKLPVSLVNFSHSADLETRQAVQSIFKNFVDFEHAAKNGGSLQEASAAVLKALVGL